MIGARVQSICEGFVVSENVECSSLEVMSEVSDREVDSEQFTVERTVAGFGWR